jgi:hypothetical protein
MMRITHLQVMCVMLDTMTVEAMLLYERGKDKGKLQTSTWLWGTVGNLIGNLLGGACLIAASASVTATPPRLTTELVDHPAPDRRLDVGLLAWLLVPGHDVVSRGHGYRTAAGRRLPRRPEATGG